MKIPYGNADFADIRRNRMFYVDKTPFLEPLENYKALVFLRPRRMGKSSLINMMAHYYDITRANEFDELFGGLWVHEHPTPEKNAHVVLHFNFGKVSGNDEDAVREGFRECVLRAMSTMLPRIVDRDPALQRFAQRMDSISDPTGLLDGLMGIVQGIGLRLYVMIDEYDTLANSLIATGERDLYGALVEKTGFVRSFYRALKAGVDTSGISRIFITGVAPLLLDDLYTGFNIATNITTNHRFNALAGFTHADVERGIDEVLASRPNLVDDPRVNDRAALFSVLEQYYDGYRFSTRATERVFNSDMVLYFLRQLHDEGIYPEEMLDTNVRTDYKRFYGLFQATGHSADERRKVLETVLNEGVIRGKLLESFGMSPTPPPREQFISLLFYTGMLTLNTEPRIGWMNTFDIPNIVIRELQWEHFSAVLKDSIGVEMVTPDILQGQIEMATRGNIGLLAEAIHEHVMKVLGLKDLVKFDEKSIKMILVTSAVLSDVFHVLSEKEFAQGFCDLFMSPKLGVPNAKYSWLIELKYLQTKASDREIAKAFAAAEEQLEKYASDKNLVPLLTKEHELKACAMVFVGAKEIRCRMWPKGSADEIIVPAKKAAAKKAAAKKKLAAKKTPAKKVTTKKRR